MESGFFREYVNYLFKRMNIFFIILVSLVIIQYVIAIYLHYKGVLPLVRGSVPEWLFIAFQLGFVLLVLVIQYLFLSKGSLSRFLERALDEPPPPQYKGDPRLFPLVRTYTLVFFLRMIQLIAAYVPSFLGVIALAVGIQAGNLTTFTVISFGLLFFSMPSSRFRNEILMLGKFVEDSSSQLATGGEDVSTLTGSDKDGET